MKFLLIIFLFNLLSATQSYPADSILKNNELSILKKVGLFPIQVWQRVSYNSNLFNCQFYPSCSNYGALAIKEHGIIKGSIITSDRIMRCNPFAIKYHIELDRPFTYKDGILIDPLNQKIVNTSKKSPLIAASLSSIIPGLGRVYSGRIGDGILGFLTFYMIGGSAILAIENKQPFVGPLLGILEVYLYFGEIYGAWRTAKYYPK